jgi:hypothetical protein
MTADLGSGDLLMRKLTRIALPVKVVLGVAVAAEIQPGLLACGAVGKGHVVVGNVVEKVNLFLLQQKTGGNRVHRSITPSLVEETAILVQRLEVVNVGLGSQPVQVADLKVGPLWNGLAGTHGY